MIIPRDIFMMILGAIILMVIVGGYELIFNYDNLKQFEEEQEERKKKRKGWIKRGLKNLFKKKQKPKTKKKLTKKQTKAKLRKMFKD